jgi:glycosyltransferase involved in cell wall biosynthesis
MRVAVVSPSVFSEGVVVGGGERYAVQLAEALSRRVPTKLVVVGQGRSRQRVGGLRVEVFPGRGGIRGDRTNPPSPEFLLGLAGCEVVHCLGFHKLMVDFAILWSRLTKRRVFCTDVGGGGPCLSLYLPRLRGPDLGLLAHGHLALSEFAARYADECFRDGRVIYGGVDEGQYQPGPYPRERRVVFVGRLLPHKGVDRLIACLPPEVPLTVAGRPYDPTYFAYLKRLARGKSVTFALNAEDDEIRRLYRRASVVVLPSVYTDCYSRHHSVPELLGLTLIEAMACGTPVVCTAVGGMPEVVRHEVTGLVVPEDDEPALREAVLRLLDTPGLGERMGRRARLLVLERFTWDRTAERCLAAYRELG